MSDLHDASESRLRITHRYLAERDALYRICRVAVPVALVVALVSGGMTVIWSLTTPLSYSTSPTPAADEFRSEIIEALNQKHYQEALELYKRVSARSITLVNPHTGESLREVYFSDGHYIREVVRDVNFILRDYIDDTTRPFLEIYLELLSLVHYTEGYGHAYKVFGGTESWFIDLDCNEWGLSSSQCAKTASDLSGLNKLGDPYFVTKLTVRTSAVTLEVPYPRGSDP